MKVDRAEQEQARRERIARAAFELFARSGLEQTSAQDIARAAFVSRTNLYRYFPSKTHMLLAHFERAVAETQREALSRLSTGADTQAVWQLVTERMADLGVRYRHLVGAVGQAVLGLPSHFVAQPDRHFVTQSEGHSPRATLPELSHSQNETPLEQTLPERPSPFALSQEASTALTLVALVEPLLLAMRQQGHIRPDADTKFLAALFVDACLLALLHGGSRNQREVLRDWQERFSLLIYGALAPGVTLQDLETQDSANLEPRRADS